MSELAPDVFAYGLAAGLSATAFLATLILLTTADGRANALALLGAVSLVLGASAVVAAVTAGLVVGAGGQLVVVSIIKLALGLMLLSLAWRVRPASGGGPALEAKLQGMEARLRQLHPATAFRVGVGVAVLPKRLAITLLAGAAIGSGGVSMGQGVLLVLLYLVTATGLIWITTLLYLVGGDASRRGLEQAHSWVLDNVAVLAFAVALIFGLLFTGQAVVELIS